MLALYLAYDYYFGPADDDLKSVMPAPKIAPGRLAESPGSAVYQVYNGIADGSTRLCFYFDAGGAAAFAHNFQAPSCEAVVARLQGQVDRDPRAFLRSAPSARHWVEIGSCAVQLRTNTTNLGRFLVTEPIPGEWIISGHRLESCPAQ